MGRFLETERYHGDSNCLGYIAFLLGYESGNRRIYDLNDFMVVFHLPEREGPIAWSDGHKLEGEPKEATVVAYRDFKDSISHVALYLGQLKGIEYEFGREPGKEPIFEMVGTRFRRDYYSIDPK